MKYIVKRSEDQKGAGGRLNAAPNEAAVNPHEGVLTILKCALDCNHEKESDEKGREKAMHGKWTRKLTGKANTPPQRLLSSVLASAINFK